MTRFFVTGGSGFIGRHLLPALRNEGDVTLLLHSGTRAPVPDVAVAHGDVTDPRTLDAVADADVVYHLAAVSFVPDTVKDPARAWAVNATGTLNVLEAARRSETLERFVYVSSGHVYGPPRYSPIDEAHPLEPVSPYGASKLAGDRLVQAYHETYGIPTTTVRTFNVYGPGQARSFLVPTILDALLKGEPPVLGDGRPVRDFLYVSDFIALLRRAARAPAARGAVVNAGTGEGHSVEEVTRTLMGLAGVEGEPTFSESKFRQGEIMSLVVDNARARELLDWKPEVPLEEGLRRTWGAEREAAAARQARS